MLLVATFFRPIALLARDLVGFVGVLFDRAHDEIDDSLDELLEALFDSRQMTYERSAIG